MAQRDDCVRSRGTTLPLWGSGSYGELVPDAKGMRGKHFSFYEFVSEVWHGLGGVSLEDRHFYYDVCVPGSMAGDIEIISRPQQLPGFKIFLSWWDCPLFPELTFVEEGLVLLE